MLNSYVANTALLLQNPGAPATLYSTANLTTFVNTARTQLAGQTECVRASVTLSVTSLTNIYNFSSITSLPTGVQGVYNVRQSSRVNGTGYTYMGSRPYPWAKLYWLSGAAPAAAAPTEWSQFGIGATGSLVLDHVPNTSYVLSLDASCYPISLTTDSDPEAIPYAFTDAVPYMAAYYAYLSAQRTEDADAMLRRYEDFVKRAQKISVPTVLSGQYDQNASPSAMPIGMPSNMLGGGQQ